MQTIGEAYEQALKNKFHHQIFYPSGQLKYEGECVRIEDGSVYYAGQGTLFHENGNKKAEGLFGRRGLLNGKMYYPSGNLRFEGVCSDHANYGPNYPVNGSFYSEDGQCLYTGKFRCRFSGLGYPSVVVPEGFGPLS